MEKGHTWCAMNCCKTLGLLSLASFASTLLHAEQTAFDVFIESCRNSGENSNLIHSGYAEFDCTENFRNPLHIVQGIVEHGEIRLRAEEKLGRISAERLKECLEDLKRMSREMLGEDDKKTRYKLLFVGNDVFHAANADDCKRLSSQEYYDVGLQMWRTGDINITGGSPNSRSVFVWFLPENRRVEVEEKSGVGREFQRFGRMQKSGAYYAMLMCMMQGDRKNFQISEKVIQEFKGKMEDKNYFFESAGTNSYDGDQTATVVEIKSGNRVVERFWIDTTRGYICPLIQGFDENGKTEKECKSSSYFLHEKSGLWYPEHYEETLTAPPMKNVYTLNRETFQLNHAVSDHMFALDIPEGTKVFDKRNNAEGIEYKAMDKGEISLAKGGLDLDKMKWLMRKGDITYSREEPPATVQWLRLVSTLMGIALIVLALYIKYRQRKGQAK